MVILDSSMQSLHALLDNHLSLHDAAEHSGYNLQYLRRLVHAGAIRAVKVGQMWLVACGHWTPTCPASATPTTAATARASP